MNGHRNAAKIAVQHLSGNLQRGADNVVTRKTGERKRISSLVEARVRRKNQRFQFGYVSAPKNSIVQKTDIATKEREFVDLVEPTQLETQIDIDGEHIIDLLTPPNSKEIEEIEENEKDAV